MALQTWPATLPAPAQYTFGTRERRRVVASADDPPAFRRFARDALVDAQVRWVFTAQHMATFDTFFQSTLAIGARWFTIPLPGRSGVVSRAARFIGPPKVSHLAAGVFDVSATLEVRAYGTVTEAPPTPDPQGIVLFFFDLQDGLQEAGEDWINSRNLLFTAVKYAVGNPDPPSALKIKIIGQNNIYTTLNSTYYNCVYVGGSDMDNPDAMDGFDLLIYTRDGANFGLTDPVTPTGSANIKAYVEAGGCYIGEFSGAAAALESNDLGYEPIGLVAGNLVDWDYFTPQPNIDFVNLSHPFMDYFGTPDPPFLQMTEGHEYIGRCSGINTALIVANAGSNTYPSVFATIAA